jgi:restriction endonuclease S subunit
MRKKVKDIASLQIGYQARAKIEPDPNGCCFIIQVKDIDDKLQLDVNSLTRFSPERDIERYFLNKQDVIFLSRGRRNIAVALDNLPANVVAAGYFYALRLSREDILPEYLAWYINRPETQILLQSMAQGTNMPLIPKSDFEDLVITIPSVEKQRTIIKLWELMLKERALYKQVAIHREQLVHAISNNTIKSDKRIKEL